MQAGADRLAAKLNTFVQLSDGELDCLTKLQSRPSTVKLGHALVQEGQTGHKAFILQAGWACSFKIMRDGSRQIIGFPIPGDCIGLRSVLLRTSDHSFSALTEAVVSGVDASRMIGIFTQFPRLGAAILWAASREEAMVVEHLVNIAGRAFAAGGSCLRYGVCLSAQSVCSGRRARAHRDPRQSGAPPASRARADDVQKRTGRHSRCGGAGTPGRLRAAEPHHTSLSGRALEVSAPSLTQIRMTASLQA